MAAVMTSANGNAPAISGVFAGKSVFLLRRLPQRTHYIAEVESHGGRVVPLEAQADYIIADDLRRDCPPGSLSYTFIDAACANGELPDPEAYRIGPSKTEARVPGSTLPPKSTRTAYTKEDDRILIDWVDRAQSRGLTIKGNELYKELEAVNNRHTWQSWRDHYLKVLEPIRPKEKQARDKVRTPQHSAARAPRYTPAKPPQQTATPPADVLDAYSEEEVDKLVAMGEDINDIDPNLVKDAWSAWADQNQSHTADEWAILWKFIAKPKWEHLQKAAGTNKQIAEGEDAETLHHDPTEKDNKTKADISAENTQPLVRDGELRLAEKSVSQASKRTRDGDDLLEHRNKRSRVEDESRNGTTGSQIDASIHEGEGGTRQADLHYTAGEEDPFEAAQRRLFGFISRSRREDLLDVHSKQRSPPLREAPPRPTSSGGSAGLVTSEANRAADRQLRYNMASVTSENGRTPLTEANLASQQAIHRQTVRAADITEDDEADDQGEFAQYSQKLVEHPTAATNGREASRNAAEDQNVQRDILTEQDIDDVIAGNSQWPFLADTSSEQDTAHQDIQHPIATQIPSADGAVEAERSSHHDGNATDGDYELPGFADDHEDSQHADIIDLDLAPPDGGWVMSSPLREDYPQPVNPTVESDDDIATLVERNQETFQSMAASGEEHIQDPVMDRDVMLGDERYGESNRQVGDLKPGSYEVVDLSSRMSTSSAEEDFPITQSQTQYTASKRALDTQAVLDMETQQPDFDIPAPLDVPSSPEDAEDYNRRKRAKARTTSTRSTSKHNTSKTQEDDFDDYVRSLEREYGYTEADIVFALEASSTRRHLAEYALAEHAGGRGWPTDKQGIWSREEDAAIVESHPEKLKPVIAKMGWDEIFARQDFLAGYQQATT